MAFCAGAGHRLVGRDGDVLEAGARRGSARSTGMSCMVEQFGFATRPRCCARRVRVDVGHDQRHVGIHAEGRGVVDHDGAALDGDRRPLARARRAGARRCAMSMPSKASGPTALHLELLVAEAHARAGAAGLRQADAARRAAKRALGEHLAQHRRRRRRWRRGWQRGARHGRSPPPWARVSSSKAACSARTAVGISSLAIMQLILIGDVEIMRRLMPMSASVRNILAATPGCERMPAPISETLPRPWSSSTVHRARALPCAAAIARRVPRRRPRAAPRTRARRRRARRSG